jgi:UDP-N-acetylmuramate--alanine ligase
VRDGDVVVTMGAGSIGRLPALLVQESAATVSAANEERAA